MWAHLGATGIDYSFIFPRWDATIDNTMVAIYKEGGGGGVVMVSIACLLFISTTPMIILFEI